MALGQNFFIPGKVGPISPKIVALQIEWTDLTQGFDIPEFETILSALKKRGIEARSINDYLRMFLHHIEHGSPSFDPSTFDFDKYAVEELDTVKRKWYAKFGDQGEELLLGLVHFQIGTVFGSRL